MRGMGSQAQALYLEDDADAAGPLGTPQLGALACCGLAWGIELPEVAIDLPAALPAALPNLPQPTEHHAPAHV